MSRDYGLFSLSLKFLVAGNLKHICVGYTVQHYILLLIIWGIYVFSSHMSAC